MPNYCENDLWVVGPKEPMEELLKFAAGENAFDFNKFIRYPEEYRRLDDIAEAWGREHARRPDAERGARPEDGYSTGGHDWCVANWGTKWPPFHVEVEGPMTGFDEKTLEVVFHFNTAWSPPKPVVKKAAELYPALRFELRYFECGCQFNGLFSCSGGDVEFDESGPYFGDRGG